MTFSTVKEAQKAKEELNGKKVDNKFLSVNFKRSPNEFKPEANIYVKNIAQQVTVNDLEKLFMQFGNVVSCVIKSDDKG